IYFSFFFFQAEDGIRDRNVTGVQTCALPISVENKVDGFSSDNEADGIMNNVEADGSFQYLKGDWKDEQDIKQFAKKLFSIKDDRSEEHTSELQSRFDLVCRLLLEKKK